jgi:hypothetical protein
MFVDIADDEVFEVSTEGALVRGHGVKSRG